MRCEDKAVLDLCRAYCIKRNKTLGEHGRQGPARGEPPSLCRINASLGNYLKLKDDFEEREAKIQVVVPEETSHQEIYQTLIAVYNNSLEYYLKYSPINILYLYEQ